MKVRRDENNNNKGNTMQREIGSISNYYGGLSVKEENGRYFWGIQNWNGTEWEEIPKSLFKELVKYDTKREKTK